MSERILFVDDDSNLLAACERTFRRQFQLDTANSGQAGLAKLEEHGPYAVVVSDRQMPGMDGIQFLSAVRQRAPETVRIMLTGNVDLQAAVRVVNEGNIFRFLIKPCSTEVLGRALEDALAFCRAMTAEKELLNKTLSGSVKLLTDILATLDSRSFGLSEKLRNLINEIIQKVPMQNPWEVHLAAMLAPIGYLTLPPETVVKAQKGELLSKMEEQLVQALPETAARLLANIPRLQGVAKLIRYQDKHYDGTGFPADGILGDAIPDGARLLKIVFDLAQLQAEGLSAVKALDEMQQRRGWYDPRILAAVRVCFGPVQKGPDAPRPHTSVTVADLSIGMVLYSALLAKDGTAVLPAGHHINQMSLQKIHNFERLSGIREPIFVEIAR